MCALAALPEALPGALRRRIMAKKKKLASQAPVHMTRGQISRREREKQRIRNLYTAAFAVGTLVVLVLGWAVMNTFVLRPNAQVAKVGDVTINRAEYNKARRYNLYQQIQNAAIMQSLGAQGAALQPGESNLADLQRALQNVETESTLDADTVNQLIDGEVLRQASASEFGINPSKDELREFAYKDFMPTPTPLPTPTEIPVTPSATITGTTATVTPAGSPTATPSPTRGSPTLTPTVTATLPPVAGAQETAVSLYNRYSAALDGSPNPQPASSYCIYGCPDISEDDFLKIAFEPRYRKDQVTDKLTASISLTEATQIRVQHILTTSQELANKVIAELDKGADFTKLANEQSSEQIDNIKAGREPNGGVIEWFPQEGSNLVQEFVDCAFKIEVGKYGQPCQTSFGWHVIKVLEKDESRPRDQTQIDALKTKKYDDWFNKVKGEYQSSGRLTSVLPPAVTLPTQPAIVDPTSPPVQQPTTQGTPPNPDAPTLPGSPTVATTPGSIDTAPTSATTPGTGTTPTAIPNQ
jgi:parvulin-like peptidyl-prolyl isomerase